MITDSKKMGYLAHLLVVVVLTSGCKPASIIDHSLTKITTYAFPNSYKRSYIELKGGEKIFGENFSTTTGLAGGSIQVDGRKFKIKNTTCKVVGGTYYLPLGHDYAERIIWGKLSVYMVNKSSSGSRKVPNPSGIGWSTDYYSKEDVRYYLQKGDGGTLIRWKKLSDLNSFITDCPEAVTLLNSISKKDTGVSGDNSPLVKVLKTYNSCK